MKTRNAVHIQEDDLIEYVMGTLKDAQLFQLTSHISICSECRAQVASMQNALAGFSAAALTAEELPVGARDRFLARLNTQVVASSSVAPGRPGALSLAIQKSFAWMNTPLPYKILSGALAAGMLFFAYDDAMHYHQIRVMMPVIARFERQVARVSDLDEFLQSDNVQAVSLHTKPTTARLPEGHALYSSRTGKLVFTASNLAPIPKGKAYELWLLPRDGSAPIPAGVFTPSIEGNAAIIFPQLPPNITAAGFGVTLEDAAGAKTPTLPILLSGE